MLGFCHCGATRGASFPEDLAICRPSVPANAMFKTVYSNFKSNYVVIKKSKRVTFTAAPDESCRVYVLSGNVRKRCLHRKKDSHTWDVRNPKIDAFRAKFGNAITVNKSSLAKTRPSSSVNKAVEAVTTCEDLKVTAGGHSFSVSLDLINAI